MSDFIDRYGPHICAGIAALNFVCYFLDPKHPTLNLFAGCFCAAVAAIIWHDR